MLVGLGVARFGLTPLIPVLVASGWIPPTAGGYVGAANLCGYIVGAGLGVRAARRVGLRAIVRIALTGATASLLACAAPLGIAAPEALANLGPAALSAGVMGALIPAMPQLALGAVAEHVPPADQARAWAQMTVGFALALGLGSSAMAAVFVAVGAYAPLFMAACVAALLGSVMSTAAGTARGSHFA